MSSLLELWETNPRRAKSELITGLSRRLVMTRHACDNPFDGTGCPLEGSSCSYKLIWQERERVTNMSVEDLAIEMTAELNKASSIDREE